MTKPPTPPPGYRFDAFADARMGKSLFQMEPEDWLVKETRQCPHGEPLNSCADCAREHREATA